MNLINYKVIYLQVKEYELSEVFHHAEDDHQYEVLKMEHLTQNSINILNGNSDIETAIEEEREEQEVHRLPPTFRQFPQPITSTYPTANALAKNNTEDRMINTM